MPDDSPRLPAGPIITALVVLFLLVALGLVGFTVYAQLGWWGLVDVPRWVLWVDGIGWGLIVLVMVLRAVGSGGKRK